MGLLSTKLPWELANTKWAAILNPFISKPMLNGNQITSVTLTATVPKVINHLLQRMPQGWFLTDIDAKTNVWRTQNFTDTTVTLRSDTTVTISFWIF